MRKFTAILLFIAFAIAQYAKQASYLECTLANYLKAPSEKCDCVKILNIDKDATDQSPSPAIHNHTHIDESYFPPLIISRVLYFADADMTFFIAGNSRLNDGVCDQQYRPPALSRL